MQCLLLTIRTSPLNAEELAKQGGVVIIAKALSRALEPITAASTDDDIAVIISGLLCQILMAVAESSSCLDEMHTIKTIPRDIVHALTYVNAPKLMQSALETVCVLALHSGLQLAMCSAGIVYRVVPLLLRYDYTLEEGGVEAKSDTSPQEIANQLAKLAVLALGRLSGVDPASPANPNTRAALHKLLTPVLSEWICKKSASAVLRGINGTASTPTIIWNNIMRTELSEFLRVQLSLPAPHNPDAALTFNYTQHVCELQLAGVYIRIYNSQPKSNLKDPEELATAVWEYLSWRRAVAVSVLNKTATPACPNLGVEGYNVPSPVDDTKHAVAALTAIKFMLESHYSTTAPVAIKNIEVLFSFTRTVLFAPATLLPQLALSTIAALCSSEDMIKGTAGVYCDVIIIIFRQSII